MKSLLGAVAIVGALSTTAFAADYGSAPVDVWSGFYVGVQGGYAWGEGDITRYFSPPEYDNVDVEGGLGGLYAGYNWNAGSFVFGLESSISLASIDGAIGPSTERAVTEIDVFGDFRGRVGVGIDNVLLYAAGGLAYAHQEASINSDRDEDWVVGWTVGAGVEAKIADGWSARVEYLYASFQEGEFSWATGGPVPRDEQVDLHIVRGGIAYNF